MSLRKLPHGENPFWKKPKKTLPVSIRASPSKRILLCQENDVSSGGWGRAAESLDLAGIEGLTTSSAEDFLALERVLQFAPWMRLTFPHLLRVQLYTSVFPCRYRSLQDWDQVNDPQWEVFFLIQINLSVHHLTVQSQLHLFLPILISIVV